MNKEYIDSLIKLTEEHFNIAITKDALCRRYPYKMVEFLSRIEVVESGCWLFLGNIDVDGYGSGAWNVEGFNYTRTYRISFALFKGHISKIAGVIPGYSDVLCHSPNCVSRLCSHPDHVRLGTHYDNAMDAVKAGRVVPPNTVGINNPSAKLTEADIPKIRELTALYGDADIGDMFGVSKTTIRNIRLGFRWGHV